MDGMGSAPIVVHRPSASGGRRVSVRHSDRTETLGTAFSDHDLCVFIEKAGMTDPGAVMDDPSWVEWEGDQAHQWGAA
ncbi:hypothetical protein JCM4914_35940 [Streptomyces platensis subsp. malvinus]